MIKKANYVHQFREAVKKRGNTRQSILLMKEQKMQFPGTLTKYMRFFPVQRLAYQKLKLTVNVPRLGLVCDIP